jgi:hypothetical protein
MGKARLGLIRGKISHTSTLSQLLPSDTSPSILKKYEHSPNELFFWNTKEKKFS